MAKSNKQRQKEYRGRRREQGLCLYPGCPRRPRKYAYCPDHRKELRDQAEERTLLVGLYENHQAEISRLLSELEETRRERDRFRDAWYEATGQPPWEEIS